MTAQPNTDPKIRARLMAACNTNKVPPIATLRARLARGARSATFTRS